MKKIIVFFSVFIVIISVFTACNKNNTTTESAAGTAHNNTNATMNVASSNANADHFEQEVGSVQTSKKFDNGSGYYIEYYDENGIAVKAESYDNGKMTYYYTVILADQDGNGSQLNYYTPSGTFVAMQKNATFYDPAGNVMTETEFEEKIGS